MTASPPGVRQVLAVRVAFVDHARSSPKNALLICWLKERAAWLHPEQGGSSSWTLLASHFMTVGITCYMQTFHLESARVLSTTARIRMTRLLLSLTRLLLGPLLP